MSTQVVDSAVLPDVSIGRRCRCRKAVIDKGCQVPDGTVIGEDLAQDARRFAVNEKGVVLVTPAMLGQTWVACAARQRPAGDFPVRLR
jgi:glucose-1-phosphate adenylyltransferase